MKINDSDFADEKIFSADAQLHKPESSIIRNIVIGALALLVLGFGFLMLILLTNH
jgi:hypothetical protein